MKVREYEGGIPDGWRDVPAPRFMPDMDTWPCSCRGEAHDECAPDDDITEEVPVVEYDVITHVKTCTQPIPLCYTCSVHFNLKEHT